ncbi:hypothetical protein U1Q18_046438 [Sarracenia purpurea var. burkii]
MSVMSIIFAQTESIASLHSEDRAYIRGVLRDVFGIEFSDLSESEQEEASKTDSAPRINWRDGEDPIRKIMRAVFGEEAYPVQRVTSEKPQPVQQPDTRPSTKSEREEKPKPEQKPDTHLAAKSIGEDGKPISELKPDTRSPTKSKVEEKPKPKQKPDTRPPAKSQGKRKSNPKRKPGTRPTAKSKTNSPPPHQTSTTKSLSSSGQSSPTTPGNQYTLPDKTINKQTIDGFKYSVDETWSGPNYVVRFKRDSPEGDTKLWWTKGDTKIFLHKYASGVTQEWIFDRFPRVKIELYKGIDNGKRQTWSFPTTKLDYTKNNWMPISRDWMNGKKDESSLKKYAEAIQSWCNANDFFVGKDYCVIFFTTRID